MYIRNDYIARVCLIRERHTYKHTCVYILAQHISTGLLMERRAAAAAAAFGKRDLIIMTRLEQNAN